jgi:energy-converting hydrogenase Eha subunit G
MRFMVRAVREILDGIPPKKALCLDSEGRRHVNTVRDINIALMVYGEYMALKSGGSSIHTGDINYAIGKVASRHKIPKRTVLASWRKMNSLGGVSDLVAAMEAG